MPNKSPDDRAPTGAAAADPAESTPPPAPTLSATQRRELRAEAHHLDPVVMIGDSGLTRGVLAEIGRALDSHQLIKIRVLGDDREERGRVMERICSVLGCAPIQMIGKLLVVWRPAAEKAQTPKRTLSKKKAALAAERPSAVRSPSRETRRPPAQTHTRKPSAGTGERAARPATVAGATSRTGRPSATGTRATGASGSPRPSTRSRPTEGQKGPSRSRPAEGKTRSATGSGKPRSQSGAGPSRTGGAATAPRGTRSPSAGRGGPAGAGRTAARKRGSHS